MWYENVIPLKCRQGICLVLLLIQVGFISDIEKRLSQLFYYLVVSTFQTDFYVCGVAPLHDNQIVVLGYPKERDEESNKALRPVLYVLEYKTSDYVEICTDSLSLRG